MEVGGGTRLSLVAALCRTSVDTIQDLNPELRKSTVPPGGKYALKIPAGRTEELVAGLAKVPAGKGDGRAEHVSRGPGRHALLHRPALRDLHGGHPGGQPA